MKSCNDVPNFNFKQLTISIIALNAKSNFECRDLSFLLKSIRKCTCEGEY